MDYNIEEIISLYESGLSQKEIADKLNVSLAVIRDILKKKGYKTEKYRHLHPLLHSVIINLIKNGYTQKYVSKVCDLSFFTIKDVVKRENLKGLSKECRRKKRNEIIVELYKRNHTKKYIKNVLHVELKTINKALAEVGLYTEKSEIENNVVKQYLNNKSINEIADNLNISNKRVKRILLKKGEMI